jgi:hypothetical protein
MPRPRFSIAPAPRQLEPTGLQSVGNRMLRARDLGRVWLSLVETLRRACILCSPSGVAKLRWRRAVGFTIGPVLVLAKLWVTRGQSLLGIGASPGDDRLFMELASHLTRGQWLGPYNHLTLVKMPFYSMWVAASFGVGLPLLFGEQLLYALACWALVRAVRPVLLSRFWRLILFGVLLWSPWSFADQCMTRAAREGIYPALTILVFAGAAGLSLRFRAPLPALSRWVVLLGFSGAAMWLTREEGVWIVPMVAVTLAAGIQRPVQWRRACVATLGALAIGSSVAGFVLWKNWRHYGMAVLAEETGGAFTKAYRAMVRVRPAVWRRSLPLPRDVRQRLYSVSPSLAKLKDDIEGPRQAGWIGISCGSYGLCDDIGAGAIHFALRDAAARLGLLRTGPEANQFWLRVADEINAACAAGRLDCEPNRLGNAVVTGWRHEHWQPMLEALAAGVIALSRLTGVAPRPTASVGPLPDLEIFRDMTRERLAGLDAQVRTIRVSGWVLASNGEPLEVGLVTPSGPSEGFSVQRRPRPDLAGILSPADARGGVNEDFGFTVRGYCPTGCSLVVSRTERGKELARIPLDGSTPQLKDLKVGIDEITPEPSLPRQERLDARRLEWLDNVSAAYRALIPSMGLLAVAAWILTGLLSIRRRQGWALWVTATGALVGCLSRIFLLAVVSAIAFPAINVLYICPAAPLLLSFIVLSIAAAHVHLSASWLRDSRGLVPAKEHPCEAR